MKTEIVRAAVYYRQPGAGSVLLRDGEVVLHASRRDCLELAATLITQDNDDEPLPTPAR